METIVSIQDISVHYGRKTVLHNLSWTIRNGENEVLRGESGSGKTTLAKAITGNVKFTGKIDFHFNELSSLPANALFVESWYRFTNLEGDRNFYYQQRYNHQQKKETLTVGAELEKYGEENALDREKLDDLLIALNFGEFFGSQLIELSSGEHKKLQLIKAIWLQPQLLIIDQPYIGLDTASRRNLNELFNIVTDKGTTLILITNDLELPDCIDRISVLENGKLHQNSEQADPVEKPLKPVPHFLTIEPDYKVRSIVSMRDISVRYGDKQILSGVNWEVQAGEKWLLQGHNGSGKSTLLSLITADHPQAYANDIRLFGVRRGEGESIWDIKKRLGLISPEFHWYFDSNATVFESIASGFFDSNGLYQQLRYSQKQKVNELLEFFELEGVKNELLSALPLGKQRLALLGRTIIKNPELLILDEPCQGLDQQQTRYFNRLIDEISRNGITIIYVGHFETQLPQCIDHKIILRNGKKETEQVQYQTKNQPVLN